MASCLLFHGPGAQRAALKKVDEMGWRLVAAPFGEDGLKVDDAREAVSLLSSAPVGMKVGVVIIGPMDEAKAKASDVLLKSIEEFSSEVVQPILWAHDLGGVSPTIRSRCLDHWAPPNATDEIDNELVQLGGDIINTVYARDYWKLPELLAKADGNELELVGILAEILSTHLDQPPYQVLWERLRLVARWGNPTPLEILSALLGNGDE